MHPLRFVFVLTSLQLYGGVLLVIEYANGLAQRGHSIQLLTPKDTVDPNLIARLHPSVALLECSIPIPDGRSPLALGRLLWAMGRELPPADITVATHTPTTAAVLLSSILGCKYHDGYLLSFCRKIARGTVQLLASGFTSWLTPLSRQNPPSKIEAGAARRGRNIWLYMDYPIMFHGRRAEAFLLRWMPRCFDMIWTISNPLSEYVSTQTNAPIVMTGTGLQNADLLAEQAAVQTAGGQRRVLYVGNDLPRKGLREFLAALQLVSTRIDAITIVVAGSENCLPVIEEFKRKGLAAEIEFHAWPPDAELIALYGSADLFASTSWSEGLGYPPLEAMACGTPVVLTDSGGVRDYARDGENCLVVAPRDVDGIAAAVERLLTDDELAMRLSHAGKETASQYDWATVVDRIENAASQFYKMD